MSIEHERFLKMVVGRDFTVHVSEGIEQRLRANIDRCNRDMERCARQTGVAMTPDQLFDPDDDVDLMITLMACVERGLEASERDDGVVGMAWGEMRSVEIVNEERHRRQNGA